MRTTLVVAVLVLASPVYAEERPIGLATSELSAIRLAHQDKKSADKLPKFSPAAHRLLVELKVTQVVARSKETWLYRESDYILTAQPDTKEGDYEQLAKFLQSETYRYYQRWVNTLSVDTLRGSPALVAEVLEREREGVAKLNVSAEDRKRFDLHIGRVLSGLADDEFGEVAAAAKDGRALRDVRLAFRKDEAEKIKTIYTGVVAQADGGETKYAVEYLHATDSAWRAVDLSTARTSYSWNVRDLDKDLVVIEYGPAQKLYVKGPGVRRPTGKKIDSMTALVTEFAKPDNNHFYIETTGKDLKLIDRVTLFEAIGPKK